MASRESWEVEPFVRVGPFAVGTSLSEVIAVLGEQPRSCHERSILAGRTCYFPELSVGVDVDDGVEEVSFGTRGSIVPVYRGIKLLGNWKSARTRLTEVGLDTPEPDRNDEQTIFITDGLVAWSRFEHVGVDVITVTLRTPLPKH